MEDTQNGSWKVCNRSSSMFKQPSLRHIKCLSTEGFKEEEESSDRPLSCSEALMLIPNGETILKNWDVSKEKTFHWFDFLHNISQFY